MEASRHQTVFPEPTEAALWAVPEPTDFDTEIRHLGTPETPNQYRDWFLMDPQHFQLGRRAAVIIRSRDGEFRLPDYKILSDAGEQELAKQVANGNVEARELFINHNLRSVGFLVRKYSETEYMNRTDHFQNGILGLIRAVERFDHRKGVKFSTHASPWIRQSIQRGIDDQNRAIRRPVRVEEKGRTIARVSRILEAKTGRPALIEDIALSARLTPDQVSKHLEGIRATRVTSYHNPRVDYDNDHDFTEIIPDNTAIAIDPLDSVTNETNERYQANLEGVLAKGLQELPPEQSDLLKRLNGIGQEPVKKKQIAREKGISVKDVTNMQRAAMRRLAKVLVGRKPDLSR